MMSTRSTIALEYADGTVHQVYCHFDGYLTGVGADLVRGYSDPFALRDLIDGGDMSYIGEPYTARGEQLVVRKYANIAQYQSQCQSEEYDYILRPVGGEPVWFVRTHLTSDTWMPLDEVVKIVGAQW
jgi:hypothetical protein